MLKLLSCDCHPTDLELATAADAQQRALWQSSLSDPPRDGDQRDAADAQAVAADCRLWWTPRVPPLVANTKEATFQLQVNWIETSVEAHRRFLGQLGSQESCLQPIAQPTATLLLAAAG